MKKLKTASLVEVRSGLPNELSLMKSGVRDIGITGILTEDGDYFVIIWL